MCVRPMKGFWTGYLTDSGKKDLILCRGLSNELSTDKVHRPISLTNAPHVLKNGHAYLVDPIDVPCGTCVQCRMERAKEWKIRNCLELQHHKVAWFLTLTYDDAHLPIDENGQPFLKRRDIQLFLKRLRKFGKIRYFGCGEYGDNTARPHYHLLIYGMDFPLTCVRFNGYTSPVLEKTWKLGSHLLEPVSPGSIAYVCGYVEKKQKVDLDSYPVRPFVFMSTKPGIGMEYFENHKEDLEKSFKVYGIFGNERVSAAKVPRAFKKKLEGVSWYDALKDYNLKVLPKRILATKMAVYSTSNLNTIHDVEEEGALSRLAKTRKVSL